MLNCRLRSSRKRILLPNAASAVSHPPPFEPKPSEAEPEPDRFETHRSPAFSRPQLPKRIVLRIRARARDCVSGVALHAVRKQAPILVQRDARTE